MSADQQTFADHERTLREILDHSFEFIGLLDPAGRLLRANQTSLRLIGMRKEDVLGQFFWDTPWWSHSSQEQARLRDAVARAARGEFVRFETTHPTTTGEERCIDFSLKPLRDDQGAVIGLIPEGRDITERKLAEHALRESEEKFAKAFGASPNAISISVVATGKFLEVNEGFERLSGYSRDELIGRTALELGIWENPEDRRMLLEELQRKGSMRNRQVRARSRTGETRDYLMSAETVVIGGQACLVILSQDISDRLRAELALRESEEKFAKAFRSSPHSLIITELQDGRYIDVNQAFERVTGYARDEVLGRTSHEIGVWVNPLDREELMRHLQAEGLARDLEFTFRRKDGKNLITRCSFETIELSGRKCLLSTISDITAQRRTEEQKASLEAQLRQNQKLEALGTLAGGIAHDFNNILTAIIVNQELALMDLDQPESVRERLGEIKQASGRAKELVRQILTFSRAQRSQRLQQKLQLIIREALGLLRASLPATIEIIEALAPDAPMVLADASQIHQVMMNLCTNAAHAMRDRPGRLTVQLMAHRVDEEESGRKAGLRPGRYAHLRVADTGHGIDTAVLPRIFEPFFTTKGPGEGTGLGLPVVHGIVQDHQGAIFVESSPGNGTTFDLYFPEVAEPAPQALAIQPAITPGAGESVLLVEDEPAIGEAVGAMLRRIGYRVRIFVDPIEALQHLRSAGAAYDLLLTDRTMPGLSGPQLIIQARKERSGIACLLMSGMNSAAADGVNDPGNDYGLVAKPIDMIGLSNAVRQALQQSLKLKNDSD